MRLLDTQLFQALMARNTANSRKYIGNLEEADDDIEGFLPYLRISFIDYPDHGIQHSYRILEGIANAVKNYIDKLSDTEIYCLIMAALFHDTGMCLTGFASKEKLRDIQR